MLIYVCDVFEKKLINQLSVLLDCEIISCIDNAQVISRESSILILVPDIDQLAKICSHI